MIQSQDENTGQGLTFIFLYNGKHKDHSVWCSVIQKERLHFLNSMTSLMDQGYRIGINLEIDDDNVYIMEINDIKEYFKSISNENILFLGHNNTIRNSIAHETTMITNVQGTWMLNFNDLIRQSKNKQCNVTISLKEFDDKIRELIDVYHADFIISSYWTLNLFAKQVLNKKKVITKKLF